MHKLLNFGCGLLSSILCCQPLWSQDNDIWEQISRTAVPTHHLHTLADIISDYESECERFQQSSMYASNHEPSSGLHIDPQAIYRVKIHDSGLEATVFQANPVCGDFGNIWRATGSIRTFILVNDAVFVNWLSGPPDTVRIDEHIVLVLPLDPEQCAYLDESIIVDVDNVCYGALIWEPIAGDFYGYGASSLLNLEI